MIDLLAVALDRAGPAAAVSLFGESPREENVALLDGIWRFDHPRLVEVLEALGKHVPDKAVAKAARKALVRHRSVPPERRIRPTL